MTNDKGRVTDGSDDVADSGSSETATATDTTGDATILVVDDEEPVLGSFQIALESAGYDVVTAENGGEAIVQLDRDIDIVLLDRRMPGMSGDEVLDHVQKWHGDCRVVMVTAVDVDTDIVDMTFDEYLTKPVSGSELVESVERLLLFDRYEELLSEYHSLTRTYATLKATFEEEPFENEAVLETVEDRRNDVSAALKATVEQFSDETVIETLQQAHGELP